MMFEPDNNSREHLADIKSREEILEVNNSGNNILLVFKICSKCEHFLNLSKGRIELERLAQMCLKNEMKNLCYEVRTWTDEHFDIKAEIGWTPECFKARKKPLGKL